MTRLARRNKARRIKEKKNAVKCERLWRFATGVMIEGLSK